MAWDHARQNVYRTGLRDCYDLAYAEGENWEQPEDVARRLARASTLEIFEAAKWWLETSSSTIMRILDGTLKGDHLGVACTRCGVSPIKGVRYTLDSAAADDTSTRDVFGQPCPPATFTTAPA